MNGRPESSAAENVRNCGQTAPDRIDAAWRLSVRLEQAEALLCATIGEPGAGWRLLEERVQEAYLWAVWDLICAARADLQRLDADSAGGSP